MGQNVSKKIIKKNSRVKSTQFIFQRWNEMKRTVLFSEK